MNEKKILFVSNLLAYGGASKLINDLLPRFCQRGYYCELLILTDKNAKYIDNLEKCGIKVTVVPNEERGHIRKIKYIKKYIYDNKFDIVHANLFPVIYYCSFIKKKNEKRDMLWVMTEHSTDNRRRHIKCLKAVERYIYKKYDYVISISDKTQEHLLKWLEPKKTWCTKFCVIENGIPLKHFKNANAYERSVVFPQIHSEDVLLCMVGSFSEQKNHSFIIKVMNILPEKYKLLLVGEGPLMEDIKEEVRELLLENRIHFIGFRTDVAEIMHTSDIVVIPSKWEGFGLIAAEAMATGTPIVASDVPGLAEVVDDCGIKVEAGEVEAYAKAVMAYEDIKLRDTFVSRELLCAEKYDIEQMADRYIEIYQREEKES